eukprot:TRINITY_DN4093_c0_g1_i2.p1 TRINITY_DN4093_c0_g1~~TRINITY_DN4093_c0_g1_i2.p1  ORF type:complete len:578 (+),score=142.49 TRINITY_DN4093_c0_g1_i2:124-1857(+)
MSPESQRSTEGTLEYDVSMWHEQESARGSMMPGGSSYSFARSSWMTNSMNTTTRGRGAARSARRTATNLDLKNLFISPNEIQLKEKIGSGGSGVVRRGIWSGTEVAVKQLFIGSQGVMDLEEMELLRHEAAVFASLRHPNVALFLGACLERPTCFIVTQLYPKGSLQDLLHNKAYELSWDMKCRLAGDAARGLKYLHTFNPPIIHRDMKSSNILIDESFRARITDFGLTKHRMFTGSATSPSDDIHTTNVGTLRWTAPELLAASIQGQDSMEYAAGVDVYSFGVVMFEIAMRKLPFEFVKYNNQVEKDVIAGKRPTSYPGCSPPGKLFWHKFGTPWSILMEDCWHQNPTERPAMEVVVERLERLSLSSGRIEDIEPKSAPAAIQMAESPQLAQSLSVLTEDTTLTVEEQLEQCRIENQGLRQELAGSSRKLRGAQAEKDAAFGFITELHANLGAQQNECAYLRQKLREYQAAAKEVRNQYWREQNAELKKLQEGGKKETMAQMQRLRRDLAEKSAELNRITELCRAANQEVDNCNVEILSLKRRLKQNRSGDRGSANSSLNGSKVEPKMFPGMTPTI